MGIFNSCWAINKTITNYYSKPNRLAICWSLNILYLYSLSMKNKQNIGRSGICNKSFEVMNSLRGANALLSVWFPTSDVKSDWVIASQKWGWCIRNRTDARSERPDSTRCEQSIYTFVYYLIFKKKFTKITYKELFMFYTFKLYKQIQASSDWVLLYYLIWVNSYNTQIRNLTSILSQFRPISIMNLNFWSIPYIGGVSGAGYQNLEHNYFKIFPTILNLSGISR